MCASEPNEEMTSVWVQKGSSYCMLLCHREVTVQEGDGASRGLPCVGTALQHSQATVILGSAPLQPQPAETSSPAVR